jgi:hypothetical protein
MVSAANSEATARIIFFPAKNNNTGEKGHNCRDFASHGGVSARDFQKLRLKRQHTGSDGRNVPLNL